MNQNDFAAIVPVLMVTLAACTTMVAEAFRPQRDLAAGRWFGTYGLIGLGGAIAASLNQWNQSLVGFGVISVDNFTVFFNITLCAIGILTIILSAGNAGRDHLLLGEYYTLILFAIVGMMLMASTTDLLVIVIALEIMSLGVYVLTAIKRSSA